MQFDLNKIKNIENRPKSLVYGFCKEYERRLQRHTSNVSFLVIPEEIFNICLLFYYFGEYFEIIGKRISYKKHFLYQ